MKGTPSAPAAPALARIVNAYLTQNRTRRVPEAPEGIMEGPERQQIAPGTIILFVGSCSASCYAVSSAERTVSWR